MSMGKPKSLQASPSSLNLRSKILLTWIVSGAFFIQYSLSCFATGELLRADSPWSLVLHGFRFVETPASQVFSYIENESRKADPMGQGIRIVPMAATSGNFSNS